MNSFRGDCLQTFSLFVFNIFSIANELCCLPCLLIAINLVLGSEPSLFPACTNGYHTSSLTRRNSSNPMASAMTPRFKKSSSKSRRNSPNSSDVAPLSSLFFAVSDASSCCLLSWTFDFSSLVNSRTRMEPDVKAKWLNRISVVISK